MIINYEISKKQLSLLYLITFILQPNTYCMNNKDTPLSFVTSSLASVTTPSLAALPFILASQLPGASAYVPGTPGACFIECTANCTDYMPPLCELNWLAGFFLISFGPAVITVGGGVIGYYATLFIKKHSQYNKNTNENTPLIN